MPSDPKMYERCCHYRELMFGKHDKAIRYIAVVFLIIVITLENLGREQVECLGLSTYDSPSWNCTKSLTELISISVFKNINRSLHRRL